MAKQKAGTRGSALIYILIAIALLGLLTASLMDSSSQQTTSQNAFNLVSELNGQINYIRSAIQECVLTYPAGDTTMPANPVGADDPVRPYPLSPNNTYLSSPAATDKLSGIRCPGNPGNSNNHAKIFTGASGKFLPPKPKIFNEWVYRNDMRGVYLFIDTEKTDSYISAALQKLDNMQSKCETSYLDARNGEVYYDTMAPYSCESGRQCFIVRLITTQYTEYPQETGCPS